MVLAISVIVVRTTRKTEIAVGKLVLPLRWFPSIMVAYTGAHAFLTFMYVEKVAAVEKFNVRREAWFRLTNSTAFIFSNMRKRVYSVGGGPFGLSTYLIDGWDRAAWVSISFSVLLIIAIVLSVPLPATGSHNLRFRQISVRLLLATALAFTNWWIGSQWAIATSRLAP